MPETYEKRTPTRAAGEGPAARGSHDSAVCGLKLAKSVLPRMLLGRGGARHAREYTIREFGA